MNAPVNNSLARARKISDVLDPNDSSLNGTAETVSTVNELGGDVLPGSGFSDLTGAWNFGRAPQEETPVSVKTIDPSIATAPAIGAAPESVVSLTDITIAEGGSCEIVGPGTQSVTFSGSTGTLKIDRSLAFNGQISGLAGSDAIDLADVSYGVQTRASFVGDATGGTLTITDGAHTANIALRGNYLSSSWDLASDGSGGTTVVDPTWQTLKVGAGGWVTGLDIAPDGTMVGRTDTYGAYIWNGAQWQQLVTATSMPTAFTTQAMIQPMYGEQGVSEIQIAPSNSSIMYMMYDGYVFKTTDKGTTWTQLASFNGGAQVADGSNDPTRMDGQRMAIDPNNPNVVYVGTIQNGLFVTTDGGNSWSSVSSVPVSTQVGGTYPGITGILFDPTVGGTTGGKTNTIFASSWGNGVYESTNAGASWTHLAGGPSNVLDAAVSSTGVYYAVGDDGNDLWSFSNNTWKELLTPAAVGGNTKQAVAINPLNPSEIVTITGGGALEISYDGGTTWSGDNWAGQSASADVPWLKLAGTMNQYMAVGGMQFNPLVPNQLIVSDGIGVWNTMVPTSNLAWNTPITWNDQSAGIENLVAWEIVVPPGGYPVLASMDRAFFQITDPSAYPSSYGPVMGVTTATGFSLDYASSTPSFLVGIAEWGTDQSGYSSDGGKTWTQFQTKIPGAAVTSFGGTMAASTPTDIIWAEAGGHDPYYTLDGGQTWNPITLPGVSDWSSFNASYYTDTRTVTADRVLTNTFYLYYPGNGLYESTNGGVSWTQMYSGSISGRAALDSWGSSLQSVPGEAGNLFFTAGSLGGTQPDGVGFYRSTNQGATWSAVANVQDVYCFGYGAAAPGQSYPAIYIVGYVNSVYGIWQSNDNAQSWTQIGTNPTNNIDNIKTISGDPNVYGQVYVGFNGSGYAILEASGASSGPSVTGLLSSPSTGDLNAGHTTTLTLNLSSAVTVAGGVPTLTLNDGGVATYSGGSGTNALTFSYTVGTGQNTPSLAATAVNLNGATMQDSSGTAANLSLTGLAQTGPQIDTTAPVISAISETPAIGDLNAGKTVVYTLTMSEAVTVNTTGGAPKLALNDGGVATYTSGSGSNALNFTYTVQAGENTPDLMVSAVNLNGAAIVDGAGNAASISLTGLPQGSPQIDTAAPQAPVILSNAAAANGSVDVVGTAESGSTVKLYEGTTLLGVNTATSGGSWHINSGALSSGSHDLTATATDGAGNVSPVSIDVDPIVLPKAPTITGASPVALINGTKTANINKLSLTGTATANSTVWLFDGTLKIGTTTANANGVWSVSTGPLANGNHTFTSEDVDAGNNVSLASTAIVVNITNQAPVLTVPSTNVAATAGQSIAASSLFGATDADGNSLSYYLYDNSPSASSGHFVVNGTTVAAQTPYKITAAQLAQTTFVAGAKGTSDDLFVIAYDGQAMSGADYTEFHVSVASNRAPVLTVPATNVAATAGQSIAASSLFGATDADGDSLSYYLYDNSPSASSGHFVVNGTTVAAQTPYKITAAQLAQTTFVAGAKGTSDDLFVIAYDGQALSGVDYSEFHVSVAPNRAPVLTVPSTNVAATAGQSIAASSLFGATDADGDSLSYYLYDKSPSASSGHFVVNGTTVAAQTPYKITAAQLAQTTFVAGAKGTSDDLLVIAYDGQALSGADYTEFHVSVAPNRAPVLTVPSTNVAATAGQSIAASSLFSATDADGDAVAYYVLDSTTDQNSGHFVVNGVVQSAGAVHVLSSAQLAQTTFVTGASGHSDDIYVIASDGLALSGSDYTELHVDPSASGAADASTVSIAAGAQYEIAGLSSTSITFLGNTGTLVLDQAASFTGKISNLTGNGDPSKSDTIDLKDIQFGSGTTFAYAGNSAGGILTVSDDQSHIAKISLAGDYTNSTFTLSRDAEGGTIVIDPPKDGAATTAPSVGAAATVELSAPYAGQVTFEAASGTLKLDNPSSFSGTVAGMSAQDTIDFADINFASLQQPSFAGNSSGGVLSLTDGTHAANIALLGNYMASTFVTSSDGHGGTYVVDPTAMNQSNTLATSHA